MPCRTRICTYFNEIKELKETGMSSQFTDTLKFGLQSPLHDYYHFNCSRKNSVRTVSCISSL